MSPTTTPRGPEFDALPLTGSLMRMEDTRWIVAADRYLDLRHPLVGAAGTAGARPGAEGRWSSMMVGGAAVPRVDVAARPREPAG